MTTTEALNVIELFKSLVFAFLNGNGNRSKINQNIAQVKKITYIANTHKVVTIAPPPMTGGLVMKNVDPLDMIFNAPYGMDEDVLYTIIDMMDETIGVLKNNPSIIEKYEENLKKEHQIKKKKNPQQMDKTKVFIVHGRDNELKESVARYIEKLGLEAIILHEQPNGGTTII